jgi:hypothetical protein
VHPGDVKGTFDAEVPLGICEHSHPTSADQPLEHLAAAFGRSAQRRARVGRPTLDASEERIVVDPDRWVRGERLYELAALALEIGNHTRHRVHIPRARGESSRVLDLPLDLVVAS